MTRRLFVSEDKRHVKHLSSEQLIDTNDMSTGFISNARDASHVSLTQTASQLCVLINRLRERLTSVPKQIPEVVFSVRSRGKQLEVCLAGNP